MTHFRHCLASLSVEPSANCFMLKSVPPAEPSLQSPWWKKREPAVGRGTEAEQGSSTAGVRSPPGTLPGSLEAMHTATRLPPGAPGSKITYWGGNVTWHLVETDILTTMLAWAPTPPDLHWDLLFLSMSYKEALYRWS